MTDKHKTATNYCDDRTDDCETVLVVLLQAFGSLKGTLRLIGGLVPRYLTPERPPEVPAHVGTTDVDVVLNIALLAARGTYDRLKRQLQNNGFTRYRPGSGGAVSTWQWEYPLNGRTVVVEFLQHTDDPSQAARLAEIDGEDVSACQILHAGLAHDWYQEHTVTVALPHNDGIVKETIRFADAVTFIVLKAIAFNQRHEHKDTADLVHVMRYWGPIDKLVALFSSRLKAGKHQTAIEQALNALAANFCDENGIAGYLKDGPAKFANFHGLVEEDSRILEQRNVSAMVTYFLRQIESQTGKGFLPGA
ncbi:MAG: hypothetical protein JO171_13235 [Paludibacterium sp.]|uniref:hypothetical protein n=1 Tax=Paludibacterium sp. TaxID=1917523 RepID=UPI0025FE172F|nr:hypothetical protein [Paludibacterium sp.]MBV8048117.1 hypothetical protein [Paludibacterium sp.]